MNKILSYGFAIILGSALTVLSMHFFGTELSNSGWELAYAHDENGLTVKGSKQRLIDAVRTGKSVRIYWSGRTVEHLTDTFFLTILGGEVFAQIEAIQGQKPSLEPPVIELRDNPWLTLFSNNITDST